MDYDSAANNAIMNQLCKVCGEPAAGFHFGAFTCEGCKSFFGRTYNNISSISECKNNGECIINKKNRTACKACRLRKCLLVGMSKSGSRYGRRSNWFKIHCLLQEQQQHSMQTPFNPNVLKNPFRPHPYVSPFFQNTQLPYLPPRDKERLSSESDSGASSTEQEEDRLKPVASTSPVNANHNKSLPSSLSDSEFSTRHHRALSIFNPVPSVSPLSLPPMSPVGGVPKWSFVSRGFWFPPPPHIASPAPPDQEEPMDLSKKCNDVVTNRVSPTEPSKGDLEVRREDLNVKALPLDLTLERQGEMT
ncbi:unnamed protein product [Phaedon cochleariae]|uniref:Nuclear receptor domain-containing protein n=1 Tax=Phaedon cochleariae TaxID=80249 RepID=A0A9P0DLG5_PHACE|nr:unnamed protein product [Phaedon cochleariae]